MSKGARGRVGAYNRRLKIPATCDECKETFYTTRYDAKFCSARCRKRHQRGGLKSQKTKKKRVITWNIGKHRIEQLELPE